MARDGKFTVVNPLDDDEGKSSPEPQQGPSGGEGQVKGSESVGGESNDPSDTGEQAGKDQPKSARRGQPDAPAADQGLGGGSKDYEGAPQGDEGDQTSSGGQGNEGGDQPKETKEQRRIRELEAELAKPEVRPEEEGGPKVVKSRRTKPESELSPEEKRIRELEDQLAKRRAKEIEDQPETLEQSEAGGEGILIHFVEDGFTAQGRIWYRGQELEFDKEGRAYDQTKDRNGDSWLDLSEDEQIDRYGKVYFKPGPWRGKDYDESNAQQAERRRNRAAPVVQG